MPSQPYEMRSGQEILEALDRNERGLTAASTELNALSQTLYEAHIDEEGELVMGVGLRYQVAFEEEISRIYEEAEKAERRPPPADVRAARASRTVRVKQPDLWAEYHRDSSRVKALTGWISNCKSAISAAQSLRRAEAP